MDNSLLNRLGADRITSRQIDELIGIARGIAADGLLNQTEVAFLHKWLVANVSISDQPVIRTLYARVRDMLSDGVLDAGEQRELLETLNAFSNRDFELGEVLKATTLPLDAPEPELVFADRHYCFTGTFSFGTRKACENAVIKRGGSCGAVTKEDQRAGHRRLRHRLRESNGPLRHQDHPGQRTARRRPADRDRVREALDEVSEPRSGSIPAMNLFIDTETTGLPRGRVQPRIVSIAGSSPTRRRSTAR